MQRRERPRLEQALRRLTVEFPHTRAAFEMRFKTRAVVVPAQEGGADITGLVVGFLPDMMLKVLDDLGAMHTVPMDRVLEDRGRLVYGGNIQTQFYAPDPSGDQGSVAS